MVQLNDTTAQVKNIQFNDVEIALKKDVTATQKICKLMTKKDDKNGQLNGTKTTQNDASKCRKNGQA